MHASIPILTVLPMAAATIFGTCTPKTTPAPNLARMTYPTTMTEIYSCTLNASSTVPPFFDRIFYTNHEQTLTTLRPYLSRPTSFPDTRVVTVSGVLSRTEWVGPLQPPSGPTLSGIGRHVTFISTVTDVETVVYERENAARATPA
jgi:hypothetical protein